MLGERLEKFLQEQKKRLVKLDEMENTWNSKMIRSDVGKQFGEILYENTINWLRSKEAYRALSDEYILLNQPGVIDETTFTLSTDAPTFTTQMLPLVRKVYSRLAALDLVSVQPLKAPTGYIYYLNKRYGDTYASDSITAGDRLDTEKGTTYAQSSEKGTIREINLQMTRKLVEATTDKLKADWTLEAEQDFRSQYGIDVETELVPELADEITRELNKRLLTALLNGVAHTVNWNPTNYLPGDTDTLSRRAYRRGIYDAVIDAQAWVMANKKVDSGMVDWWLIMSPATWARFAKLENQNINNIVIDRQSAINQRYEGVLNGIFKVYVWDYMSDTTILLGINGKNWKFAVGYYAPYIPLFTSPKYIINSDFSQFARGAMARYSYGVLPETSTGSTNNGLVRINISSS